MKKASRKLRKLVWIKRTILRHFYEKFTKALICEKKEALINLRRDFEIHSKTQHDVFLKIASIYEVPFWGGGGESEI